MTDEVEVTEQVSLEIERVAIQKARIRAKAAKWSLDVAAFLFAILALLVILLFMRIGTEILAPVAVFGLATGWLMGRRGERQLYQSFHSEELFKLTRELLEEKVKKANEQLQELYEHEKALRQELESETNKRTEYIRALVHELKTPMTPILASSQLLLEEIKNEPLLSLVENINRGAVNLNLRIDELHDLARGEVGMLSLNTRRLNPMSL
ncbi:histidine kinase dimerization/phospho-acceptor domain-containing protein, partial [Chloroflexota bacterium]